jgi:hypothetical protein
LELVEQAGGKVVRWDFQPSEDKGELERIFSRASQPPKGGTIFSFFFKSWHGAIPFTQKKAPYGICPITETFAVSFFPENVFPTVPLL